jgi:putative transposase
MPRAARIAPGGMIFHVLNRGVGQMQLFSRDADYVAFEAIICKTLETCPMRIVSYCLMPNHWHFVLWPQHDGELAAFMQKLTTTHVQNWQAHRRRVGYGHVYQGRFKSFPVESDEHFYQVVRYVERNPLRANLAPRAEDWRYCSLSRRLHGSADERILLSDWPLPLPPSWLQYVNQPQSEAELAAIRRSVQHGHPFGGEGWAQETVQRLVLRSTLRGPGPGKPDFNPE